MTPLIIRTGEVRRDETIELDGHWFEGCTFTGCTLVYKGLETFGYANSDFPGCTFELQGVARTVMGTLAGFLDDTGLLGIATVLRAERPTLLN